MPTPAKLIAALLMAAVGWLTCEAIARYALPEGKNIGHLREIVAVLGLWLGWKMVGRQATGIRGRGDKLMNGLTMGLACALVLASLSVALHGFYEMITEAVGSKGAAYQSPGEGFTAMMGFIWEDVQIMGNDRVLITLFGGGALAGLLSGISGRIWH